MRPSDGEAAAEVRTLAQGEAVRAFYHANDHPDGFRFVRLLDPEDSPGSKAVIGLSTGWIPATVAEDWNPDVLKSSSDAPERRVLVRLHGTFADAYQQDPAPVVGMYWRVERNHIRPIGVPQPPAELSLLVVRWWDYWNPKSKRSRSHNVANEEMLLDVLQGPHSPQEAMHEQGGYEVHSAFIRESSDLKRVGASMATSMRGHCRAGLYFLWPTQRPAQERRLAGAVSESAMLELMQCMEGEGVRSCWPHPSGLYRQLAGKLWTAIASQDHPELRVPLTVMVDVRTWRSNPSGAAEAVTEELRALQTARTGTSPGSQLRGVVKLGFSWMGEDVRPFTGLQELEKVLQQMLDGCADDVVCMVQERVEAVACEFRLICCRDLARGEETVTWELVRMRQKPAKQGCLDSSFSLASHDTMTAAETAAMLFGGNRAVVEAAEAEVKRLGNLWLQWFRDQGFGTPGPAFRLDFLVARPTNPQEAPEVWTVELCECGGSLCGLGHHPRTAACLNECLHVLGRPAGRPPRSLPPFHPSAEHGRGAGTGTAVVKAAVAASQPSSFVSRLLAVLCSPSGRLTLLAVVLAVLSAFLRRRDAEAARRAARVALPAAS
mmetsp:Transcript_13393/g.35548  ORF Transcript_13393/g.35548 Transcript_13393/m.35548 type:complete len:605 (+) Transcript_13393:90-1904(+)